MIGIMHWYSFSLEVSAEIRLKSRDGDEAYEA